MLDINLIRENPQLVKDGLIAKRAEPELVDKFLELDKDWRDLNKKFDDLRAEQRKLGKEGKEKAVKIKSELKETEEKLNETGKLREEILRRMPNLPLSSVIIGRDENENKTIKEVGGKPEIKNPKDYFTLAQELDLIDTERAAKVSGSRFGYLKGGAALLEFALIDLAIKTLTKEGFTPIIPPVMINEKSMKGMGYMEKTGDEIYYLPKDNLYLVGTSEQSIVPMHQDEIFSTNDLPKRYVSFSACFRREAGSYGKDTKGILRVHQFNKLEMISFVEPNKSEEEHKFLLSMEEKLMQALKLPYRVLDICSGDLGDPAAAKYDIEVWMPGEGKYRETHSTSNTTDFQARRLNIKHKDNQGKIKFVHILNGTAFSERPILAILENYQTEKGTVAIPKILQDYLGFKEIARK
ncbi:MAG: seryl-tRNA synthetase [Parcubacteria group bacterium Athens0714_26]|nr:MAG: seryl-tRNA synthetase [Parcubacteria group bacterium Athens1014_26]TSD03291.1 MAG: seryl-tRNA synthetase [Parcubacteria group bacterium Athens0714_26]